MDGNRWIAIHEEAGDRPEISLNGCCHHGTCLLHTLRLNKLQGLKKCPYTIQSMEMSMTKRSKEYKDFIGIDIGKFNFVVAVHGKENSQEFSNDPDGINAFITAYKTILNTSLVIVETTGGYEKLILKMLLPRKIAVHRGQTLKIKHFIRSYGVIAKNDTLDAKALACYGHERADSLECYSLASNAQETLTKLVTRRQSLIAHRVAEMNRLQAPDNDCLQCNIEAMIEALDSAITDIDSQIDTLICEDEHLKGAMDTMISTPGVAQRTAENLLAAMPELGRLSNKQAASLAGVAPHPRDSGTIQGYRKTRGGRRHVKKILYMAALAASRSKSNLATKYQELIKRGKKPIVAIMALMRKIIVIINAKLKNQLFYTQLQNHS